MLRTTIQTLAFCFLIFQLEGSAQLLINEGWNNRDELTFNADSIKKYGIKTLKGAGYTLPSYGKSFNNKITKFYHFNNSGQLTSFLKLDKGDTVLYHQYKYDGDSLVATSKYNKQHKSLRRQVWNNGVEQVYNNDELKSYCELKSAHGNQKHLSYYGANKKLYAQSLEEYSPGLVRKEKKFKYGSKMLIDSCFMDQNLITKKSIFDTYHRLLKQWLYTYAAQQLSESHYYENGVLLHHRNFIYKNGILSNESYTLYQTKDIHWFSYEVIYY